MKPSNDDQVMTSQPMSCVLVSDGTGTVVDNNVNNVTADGNQVDRGQQSWNDFVDCCRICAAICECCVRCSKVD